MNDYEIRPGKALKVKVSTPNVRLFIGNIPKQLNRAEIKEEFSKVVAGLTEVIVYSDPLDRTRNRGFCFLEFDSHKLASQAKRKLLSTRIKLWPNADMLVDWAEPLDEPDVETMSRVKVLYVRNLPLSTSEQTIAGVFSRFGGQVERVKKIKDYAFVHFSSREAALEAMAEMQGRELFEGRRRK
ncbi:hypothetical protein TYRP_020288 [Tyrophagus putrescentiae]|nr:hypothetical protein TYRP_020288 [Tyrophagus putrescentiae]